MKKDIWEKSWSKSKPTYTLGFVSNFGYRLLKKNIQKTLLSLDLTKCSKILDIGCGEGRTLSYFKSVGFMNTTGIDASISALRLCEKRGFKINTDVFAMDASNTTFKDNEFDLVFAEGFLEHFRDFKPFAREMSRLSKRHIILIQPNHFSLFGKILNFIMEKFSETHIREYNHRIEDFVSAFNGLGFKLRLRMGTHVGLLSIDTSNILLFTRGSR